MQTANAEKMALAVQDSTNSCYQIPIKNIPTEIFRTYDIRGKVGPGGITPNLTYAIGLAIAHLMRLKKQETIILGRDGRLSSPTLYEALTKGLLNAGLNVIYIGQVPTPLLYFATHHLPSQSGIMITGSHNPGDHNGFKIVMCGHTLAMDEIQEIYSTIKKGKLDTALSPGQLTSADLINDYLSSITHRISLARPLKVVIDAGNGIAGAIAPKLYRQLGCEVITLFCDVDGRFPNHHPDPSVPENLVHLQKTVKSEQADIGLAFDGDADRLGVVTDQGEIIWPDRQLMLFAQSILNEQPGATVLFDVKCSRDLPLLIKKCGGNPIMWKTGHSLLKSKLMETNATIAGEMSGHIFFKDKWFGFDDGMYAGARLLEILAQHTQKSSQVFATLPKNISTPELKLPIEEHRKYPMMEEILKQAHFFTDTKLITLDGLRVEFKAGWGLVRASNTSPFLTLRFEADSEENLSIIQDKFRILLLNIDPDLELPF